MQNKPYDTDPQIKVTGTLKSGRDGGELIVFSIPLGFIELVCIVSIPDEGRTESPVYIKIKPRTNSQRPKPRRDPRDRVERKPERAAEEEFRYSEEPDDNEPII